MAELTCVKAGSLDGGKADIPIGVEFYTKDRVKYSAPIDGADQKPAFG